MLACETPTFEDMPGPVKVGPGPGGVGRASVGAAAGTGTGGRGGPKGTAWVAGGRVPLTTVLLAGPAGALLSCGLLSTPWPGYD